MLHDAKVYQAYYTKSAPIVNYMVNQLSLLPGDKVLEPCGGDGVFIDAILDKTKLVDIDIVELNEAAAALLTAKYHDYSNVHVSVADTLLDNDLSLVSAFGGGYDKIIANPPYGAWQDFAKRDKLRKIFPSLYTKETYSLFLYRCIQLLKEGGTLTFIIPDTFLNLHYHTSLRSFFLTNTKIKELVLFPSDFFPGVNFGYANLAIISLEKCGDIETNKDNCFKVIKGFKRVEQLLDIEASNLISLAFTQREVLSNPDHAFLINENVDVVNTINQANITIVDIAKCVTGFYSGNDKKFLKVKSVDVRNGKNYEIINPQKVYSGVEEGINWLNGVKSDASFFPIVKGGNVKYLKADNWFMDWSEEAVAHYKNDSKARFQNSTYYFKFGIGIPMVSSSSITAALIENKLFDQSIVGVFPNDNSLVYYLLGFFNSPTCNKLIRTINPSANNPANYIKKLPFVPPTKEQKSKVESAVIEILTCIRSEKPYPEILEQSISITFKEIYGF